MPYNYDHAFRMAQKRWVYVPTQSCRDKGLEITGLILSLWTPPDFYYHFQSGGHISAIQAHENNKFFAKIDLQKFFPSISRNKVLNAFKKLSISYKQSEILADWSCVVSKEDGKSRILPYGFVQSQILAALCMDKSALGKCLLSLYNSITISVYVDDIIISSNNKDLLEEAYAKIIFSVGEAGFIVNQKKSHAPKNNITAFNILLKNQTLKIEDSRFNEFIDAICPTCPERTDAIISYVSGVCKKQGNKLITHLEALES